MRKNESKWIFGIKGLHLFIALMIVLNVWWIWELGVGLWELILSNALVGGVIGGIGYSISRER